MDKSDENDHPIAFIPKAMINDVEWQVFWLTFFLRPSHSSVDDQWHEDQKVFIKAYSCGYSSGISPDSLLVHVGRKPTSEPFPLAKVII